MEELKLSITTVILKLLFTDFLLKWFGNVENDSERITKHSLDYQNIKRHDLK
jgi:hypothetical protein